MESLLPYYERELTYLRRLSHDFARRYPKIASRLLLSGETCEDPHIERLLESFAFLAGRIHKKLDDDYPEITDSLLQVVYPQYLRPFPSASIVHFEADDKHAKTAEAARIARGTGLQTHPVRGVPCRFRTAYDVDIRPLRIAGAACENAFDIDGLGPELARSAVSAIRLDVRATSDAAPLDTLVEAKLRLFLNGDPSLVASIREALFSRAAGLWVTTPASSRKIELPREAIIPVGFTSEDALLDQDARCHPAYRLLLEYFVFPEKFNFVDVDLSWLTGKLPPDTRAIEIRVGLKASSQHGFHAGLLDRISQENFVLNCTPVVNLFSHNPEPIRITETASSYPVIVSNQEPQAYDIYNISRVFKVERAGEEEQIAEFRPFYSLRHGESHGGRACYWHASYPDDDAGASYPMEIALVDTALDPHETQAAALSLELVCTNRDLPSQLPFGLVGGDLSIEGGSGTQVVRFLRKPTPSYRFPRGRGAQWRLISHLSLNHLSLSGSADAIREILTLYDITRSVANSKQVAGITAIEQRATTARITGNPFATFIRGMEIRITVDETHYAGIGLFMFAQILDHFFSLYVNANSFTQLVVMSKQSGQELIKCPARNGEAILA